MQKNSLWNHYSSSSAFPQLEESIECDVAIIGGGVCGISIAQKTSQFGLKTVVLEAREIAGGTTAHSTGNLYATTDKNLKKLLQKHDLETVSTVTKLRQEAIDDIEKNVLDLAIDCDFKRVPWYLYGIPTSTTSDIRHELETANEVGLEMNYVELTYPYKTKNAICLANQAQLNSKLYTQGLAQKIVSPTCKIYENSPVLSIEQQENGALLKTNRAHVKAKYLVHATHTPKGIKVIQSLLAPYREYGIACKIKNKPFSGIFWGYHGDDTFISSRFYQRSNDQYLIVVGQPHKVGQCENNLVCIERLEQFARQYFDVTEIVFRWGGQHYRPADFLPYIGKETADSNTYLATGFSTDGLVYGAMSAKLISELIQGKESSASHIFRPYRKDIFKSAPNFIKENANVAGQYLKEIFSPPTPAQLSHLEAGQGKVIEHEGEKIAVFKNELGDLSICSAVCPHMKCIVNWNLAEKSWDCPCHGSRFDTNGNPLEGPALEPLKKWNA